MGGIRFAAVLASCVAVTACAGVPIERIDAYTAAYAETREAAKAVYADYAAWDTARRSAEFDAGFAKANPIKQFDLLVPKSLETPVDTGREAPAVVTSALAALDAGAVYNEALVGVASGKSVAEVRASVASIAGLIGTFGGAPWIGSVLDLVLGQVEQARSREELLASLTGEVSVVVSDGETRTGHAIDILLDLLAEHAVLMFEKRRTVANEAVRNLVVDNDMTAASALVRQAAADAEVLVQYRRLLLKTKQHFAALREAALHPDMAVAAAMAVRNARDVVVQARLVLALMRGRG